MPARGQLTADHGAALRPLAVVELMRGAGALQQRLGDEEAEAEADMLLGVLCRLALCAGRVVT